MVLPQDTDGKRVIFGQALKDVTLFPLCFGNSLSEKRVRDPVPGGAQLNLTVCQGLGKGQPSQFGMTGQFYPDGSLFLPLAGQDHDLAFPQKEFAFRQFPPFWQGDDDAAASELMGEFFRLFALFQTKELHQAILIIGFQQASDFGEIGFVDKGIASAAIPKACPGYR